MIGLARIMHATLLQPSDKTFQDWGKVRKPVQDGRYRSAQVLCYRFRICCCNFRHSQLNFAIFALLTVQTLMGR